MFADRDGGEECACPEDSEEESVMVVLVLVAVSGVAVMLDGASVFSQGGQ